MIALDKLPQINGHPTLAVARGAAEEWIVRGQFRYLELCLSISHNYLHQPESEVRILERELIEKRKEFVSEQKLYETQTQTLPPVAQ